MQRSTGRIFCVALAATIPSLGAASPTVLKLPGRLRIGNGNEESISGYNEVKQPNYESGNGPVPLTCETRHSKAPARSVKLRMLHTHTCTCHLCVAPTMRGAHLFDREAHLFNRMALALCDSCRSLATAWLTLLAGWLSTLIVWCASSARGVSHVWLTDLITDAPP